MSTDDSISEDVSSSGALSHCHVSADGDGGKESEASLVSSEGTSASGLAVSEDRLSRTSQTKGGAVEGRQMDITPACNKIRSLCLSTDEAFQQGKSLPFINPSSLETLRALVQEIQSSGETDPEIWKDCEGRWLHLFQLVEKQYQEQILAQQEQYQCQIQLIQDEIKALVQLQNRQASVQPQAEFSPAPVTAAAKDYILPLVTSDCTIPKNVPSDSDSLAAPALTPFSSPSPPPQPETFQQGEGRPATLLSSGYGTLSAWEMGLQPAGSPGDEEEEEEEEEEAASQGREKRWSSNLQENAEMTVIQGQQRTSAADPENQQHRTSGVKQPLTSWAQRQKLRAKKSKSGQTPSQIPEPENQQQPCNPREPPTRSPLDCTDPLDQHRAAGPSSSSFPLRRTDSLMSEASGLTYWRLNENDLYRPLPDIFDNNSSYLLLQEVAVNLTPPQESRLSLREIYENKQRTEPKCSDWEGSAASSPLSPRVLTLDPAVTVRQSDRTSGVTSPSHFSSLTFPTQPHRFPTVGTPVTPDSMVVGDTDCISDASSVSAAGPSPCWGNASQAAIFKTQPYAHTVSQQRGASEEEEGSRTHTGTLKPSSASGGSVSPQAARASSGEDPIVLSLLRQNLREKHSRHVADLKAYYESEIQVLRDRLKLRDLPRDLEKSNAALTERCKDLEKALAEAANHIQELEAKNSSLEKQLAEWPERYAVVAATVKSLQQRLEESKRSAKDEDVLTARLKARVRQLEEAAQKSCREADEKEARREREYKMLQDLLGEYDSLMKEHEGVKNKLVSTENKLVDANDQISELKRIISKLESQVKQLEHENQARARSASHSSTKPSGAGLFHHPDLLLSPTKCNVEPDVTRRRSPCPLPDQPNSGRKSPFPQSNQSLIHKKLPCPLNDPSAGTRSSMEDSLSGGSWRCSSPRERGPSQPASQQSQRPLEAPEWEQKSSLTPMMRALIELEETRATESRAPWVGNQRSTVGFVERRHKEPIQERVWLAAERDTVKPGADGGRGGGGGGGGRCSMGAEGAAALLRAQRSLSPEGHRSSSLPPPAHRSIPAATPTKRETLLTPMSAKSSPKRCPSENYSTAFGHMMPREEHLSSRFDGRGDQRRHSFHSSSPRKRLQFSTADRDDECSGAVKLPEGNFQPGWDEQAARGGPDPQDAGEDSSLFLLDKLTSLADAERLFDELTQEKLQVKKKIKEKLQVEAALSRMPAAGSRVSLQTRLDQVSLENRLERLNRQLGSIRMTLKRFHVLPSSANI
ncbi:hypothetical protein LDENG_00183500 [Lucifuga dentata]|nr:hypothetical protein LDENG_00183500 [Lucifuga dentata]